MLRLNAPTSLPLCYPAGQEEGVISAGLQGRGRAALGTTRPGTGSTAAARTGLLLVCALAGCSGRSGAPRLLPGVAQMNAPEYTIGIPQTAASTTVVEQRFPRSTIRYFQALTDGYMAVKFGKIDAFAFDRHTLHYVTLTNPDLAVMPEKVGDELIVIGSALGREELMREVNAFLATYRADGTYQDMYKRWILGTQPSLPDLPEPSSPTRTLVVGTTGVTVPMNYYDHGKLAGFDVELARRLGNFLNARIEFFTVEYPAIIAAATTGKIDLLVANLNGTPERRKLMLFSDGYLDTEISFLVRKDRLSGGAAAEPGGAARLGPGIKASFERTFVVESRYQLILRGLWVTLLIAVASALAGTLLGVVVCVLRRSSARAASVPARLFIRAIQGTPIVLLLMILYYIVFASVDINAIAVAIVGFTLTFAAYVSEMMRAGVDAVDRGQHEAAMALGFSRLQVFARITFPQAARHVLPVYKGELVSMLKMTSVVGYIAVQDLTKMSDIIRGRTYDAFFPLIATALIYFLIAYGMVVALTRVEVRVDPARRRRVVKGVVEP